MTEPHRPEDEVSRHYGRGDLGESIFAALRAAGKGGASLPPEDLAPVDQFHLRGRDATLELARRAGIGAGASVLDLGGGLGGAARTLAHEVGCRVTVLDLTEEYCRTGERLTALTGLDGRVAFRHGSALDAPFPDGSFDFVWTQHSSMNIADKERLWAEARRVLRAGGRLAFHEIMAGEARQPIHLPVPWARRPDISHLRPPAEARALLAGLGFAEVAWVDESAITLAWLRERLASAPAARPPLGLHLLLGDDMPAMFANVLRNLEERRIAVIQAVLERRG